MNGQHRHLILSALLIALLVPSALFATDRFFEQKIAEATSLNTQAIRALVEGGMIVDRVKGDRAVLYLSEHEADSLTALGYQIAFLPDKSRWMAEAQARGLDELDEYHTYESMTEELTELADLYPELTRLSSIGQTVQERELWLFEISDNVNEEEVEPEFFYISSMHGDEVVGKENCIQFIHYLLENYASNPEIQHLVDETHLYILPSMNPDGTVAGSRFNANGVDLNRNFPDRIQTPYDLMESRQPETQAIMAFFATHSPALAANFHGGAVVVNYPWDNNPGGITTYTACPDDAWYIESSLVYANLNPEMANNTEFENGITNGSAWYAISGGMQDWSYTWRGCPHVTIELSEEHWPPQHLLPGYWDDNRDAMVALLGVAHQGVRGIVTDAYSGEPLQATISIDNNPMETFTDADLGDYYRLTSPGMYTVHISAQGYRSESRNVRVNAGSLSTASMALYPDVPGYLNWSFETGAEDFLHGPITDGYGDEWHLSTTRSSEGSHSFKCGSTGAGPHANDLDAALITPMINLEANSELTFWHYLDSEVSANYYPQAYDGGRLEILPVDVGEWELLTPVGDYPYIVRNTSGDIPLPQGAPIYGGHVNGRVARFDLSGYEGDVQLRWRFAADESVPREGWYIDDIRITRTSRPFLVAIPGVVSFPETEVGQSNEVVIQFANRGAETCPIQEMALAPPFSSSWDPITQGSVEPGESISVTFMFEPETTGLVEDEVVVLNWQDEELTIQLTGEGMPTSEVPGGELPLEFAIGTPWPNPFNSTIALRVSLPRTSEVRATLFNLLGQRVRDIRYGTLAAGHHTILWDGRSDAGVPVSSGTYFLRMRVGEIERVLPLSLVR